jgi:hypothetical protein
MGLKSIAEITASPMRLTFRVVPHEAAGLDAIAAARERIERDLSAIAKRPMTSREVQGALRISAKERIRWAKHNRPHTCGTSAVRRQQMVTLQLYAPEYIQELSRQPDIIEAWRAADRAAEMCPTRCETPLT